MINIEVPSIKEAVKRIEPETLKRKIDRALFYVSLEAGNMYATNIQDRIYSQPPSKRYKRTGAALRGRVVRKIKDGYELEGNSMLGGASKNYSMFLNKNSRIPKLHTLFFEKTVDDIRAYKRKLFNEIVKI